MSHPWQIVCKLLVSDFVRNTWSWPDPWYLCLLIEYLGGRTPTLSTNPYERGRPSSLTVVQMDLIKSLWHYRLKDPYRGFWGVSDLGHLYYEGTDTIRYNIPCQLESLPSNRLPQIRLENSVVVVSWENPTTVFRFSLSKPRILPELHDDDQTFSLPVYSSLRSSEFHDSLSVGHSLSLESGYWCSCH